MRFDIYQGEKISVTSSSFNLEGQLQTGAKYHVKLFNEDRLLIEWHLAALIFLKKVTIKYQNLPIEITEVSHRGLFKRAVWFGHNELIVKLRPLRKAYYHIFLNGDKVADVSFPKRMTLGYRQYLLETNTDDEETNLNIVIAFLLGLMPVT